MDYWFIFLLAAGAIAGVIFVAIVAQEYLHRRFPLEPKLTPISVLVPVTVNGHDFQFLVDTGATTSSVSHRVSEKLNLPKIGSMKFRSVNGEGSCEIVFIRKLEVAGRVILNTLAAELSVQTSSSDSEEVFDGILGMDVLSSYVVVIDCPNNRFVLGDP